MRIEVKVVELIASPTAGECDPNSQRKCDQHTA